jgi:cobalamin-dependent methionine synthase I
LRRYPACPDHSLKPILFELLNATENTGIMLTESQATRHGGAWTWRRPACLTHPKERR